MEIVTKSYAKVNLMLRVISKKENGYHELQMLNKKINLFDVIKIKHSDKDLISFTNKEIDNSFLLNVLNHLKSIYNIKKCYNIEIKKNIPIGAGLGGASMNASTIINEILEMENIFDSIENKINNFKHLGADIAYGFFDDICIVEGEGEKIYPLNVTLKKPMVLVNPRVFVSTKEVFENNNIYNELLEHKNIVDNLDSEDIYVNDLEISCFKIHPELSNLKNNLSKYGKVVMSGTGSSLIVHSENIEKIEKEFPNFLVMKIN